MAQCEDGDWQVIISILRPSSCMKPILRDYLCADLINPPKEPPKPIPKEEENKLESNLALTAEEEAELADLMEDD